ncbi:LOW QUALITY PROTEIN: uncharacterized protein EMH_0056590 [Eimeria mitis]|uniref:Uncharacterized protein n=1 Tax=Eimeria mitis TaxID=44415 RepID=U6JXU5_9EIME|nr:LOW QUALITY PROTEIN: uncharacterized protein EMH_0056590 [Eimeria mitis]CDJ30259.1 hypothetical protein EMH_0056590 [Eimeria mitis]
MASKYLYSAPFVAFALSFDLFSSSSLALHLRAATDAPSTGGEAFLSQHYLQATEGLDIPLDSHPSFLQTGFWKKKRGGEGRKRERERTPSPSRPRPEPDEPSPSTSGYDLPYTRQAEAALANLEADDDPFKNLPTGSLSLPSDPYGAPSESAGPSGTGSLGRTAGRGIKEQQQEAEWNRDQCLQHLLRKEQQQEAEWNRDQCLQHLPASRESWRR